MLLTVFMHWPLVRVNVRFRLIIEHQNRAISVTPEGKAETDSAGVNPGPTFCCLILLWLLN